MTGTGRGDGVGNGGGAGDRVGEFAFASARDAVLAARCPGHPQVTELRRMFAEAAPDQLPTTRRVMGMREMGDDDQFEFDLRLFIAGMESLLTKA